MLGTLVSHGGVAKRRQPAISVMLSALRQSVRVLFHLDGNLRSNTSILIGLNNSAESGVGTAFFLTRYLNVERFLR